jgi:hypothetical protein
MSQCALLLFEIRSPIGTLRMAGFPGRQEAHQAVLINRGVVKLGPKDRGPIKEMPQNAPITSTCCTDYSG